MYRFRKISQSERYKFDVSTCKLWYAIALFMKQDFISTLIIIDEIKGNIPPYFICCEVGNGAAASIELYKDIFSDSSGTCTAIQRAKRAWMLDLTLDKTMIYIVPLALGIELFFSDDLLGIYISPFTCLYYLQFLCYHKLQQFNNRERALRLLMDVTMNDGQCSDNPVSSFNIAGHCLLLAGYTDRARAVFLRSYRLTRKVPPTDKYNSALWYLQNCFY